MLKLINDTFEHNLYLCHEKMVETNIRFHIKFCFHIKFSFKWAILKLDFRTEFWWNCRNRKYMCFTQMMGLKNQDMEDRRAFVYYG